jgi:hypothetical protein
VGIVRFRWEVDAELLREFDHARAHRLAEPAQSLVEGLRVELPGEDGKGSNGRPCAMVSWRFEGEQVVEGSC